jgi:GNAT superfamily N-acetyltransferase
VRDPAAVISVRRIRPDEGGLLRGVRLAALLDAPSAFGSTHAAESDRPDAEWDERAAAGAEGHDRVTFFAIDGSDVVGLAGGYREEPGRPAIDLVSMWTDPRARRTGVGRALVQAVLDWADANGDEVSLWVTRGNDAAHALYESMGFVDTDEVQPLPSDPCKDEVRMVRRR